MKFSKLLRIGALSLACCLVANFVHAQEKQGAKDASTPKRIIVIKKGEDGKVKTEKIITNGDELHELHLDGEDGTVIVKEINGSAGKQIKVTVNPTGNDMDLDQNINVEIEEVNGEKHLRVKMQPTDGETQTFEWKGEGEIPAEIKEKLEADGIFIHEGGDGHENINVYSLDKEDVGQFQWQTDEAVGGPFLGISNAMETKVTIEIDENGEERTTESSEEEVDGILIGEVFEGSAAAEAGLLKGDILKSVDGNSIEDFNDLIEFMKTAEVGQQISLTYERAGNLKQTEATLQERKADRTRNVIIERIIEGEEGMDKGDNVFFFRTEEGKNAEIHAKHKIIVITRGDQSEATDDQQEEALTLPPTDLQRDLDLQEYRLFPNPTDGNLRLRFQAEAVPTVIQINDLSGKQMYRERLNRFDGAYDEEINLNDLPAGPYFLTIKQADKVYTEQLILK